MAIKDSDNVFYVYPWPAGDYTQEEMASVQKVYRIYQYLKGNWDDMPKDARARSLVALAHDMLAANLEEVSEDMLIEAEEVCPDYFKLYLKRDLKNDKVFGRMVDKLALVFPEISKRLK